MFPFSRDHKEQPEEPQAAPKPAPEVHPLDALTGGVFSAATSGERAQRVREWLTTEPSADQMQEVFKELSGKDKGAAKALREKLDELRRAKGQEAVAAEWASKAEALLKSSRLNIADALAWQRDAAKAGAPLSREPLSLLRAELVERIKTVEDLQQRVMVQREAAMLMAQRIELLSTKPWRDAQAAQPTLEADVARWLGEARALPQDSQWLSVDVRFPPQLESAQSQLNAVWEAFSAVLAQAVMAAQDKSAPLPAVPVWADELRADRGESAAPAASDKPERPAKPAVAPEQRAAASKAVEAGVMLLEQAVSSGNTKNTHSATAALRQSLKAHGRLIDDALEARVHGALVSAGELEGWQRWSADKVREQLVAKAEALLVKRKLKGPRPAAPELPVPEAASEPATEQAHEPAAEVAAEAPAAELAAPSEAATADAESAPAQADAENTASADEAAPSNVEKADEKQAAAAAEAYEIVPAMGGRKLQETIRKLREEWKATDQGGAPNHGLWKRFDRACSEAHKFVEQWLSTVRAEAAAHRAERLALIEEVKAWGAKNASAGEGADWKSVNRHLHQFSERWRNAGHLAEKAFAELQPQWKDAIHTAAAPLEAAQKSSTERRQAMIAEAEALGAAPMLRIDAVKALQQRWQAEAQTVPLDRRFEQKLWDAFRKPIDEAFNRKTQQREQVSAAMSAHDRAVLDAAKALEAANASGDGQRIRAALAQLEAATRGEAVVTPDAGPKAAPEQAAVATESAPAADGQAGDAPAGDAPADDAAAESAPVAAAPVAPPKPAKPLVAMRGDDRPGARKIEPAAPARGGKFGDRRDGRPGDRRDGPAKGGFGRDSRGPGAPGGPGGFGDRGGRFNDRPERGPRLGDAAFRAQRDAMDHAQAQLRKLAAQAHGETLTQLLGAWAARQPEQLPSAQELGRGVSGGARSTWVQALQAAPQGSTSEPLLRLEMAAEVPTPAEQLDARRALQLQLLTRRNEPGPADTWAADAGKVLAAPHDEAAARRLQNALKVLMRK
ncbi:DUF349 domain-containing protein [Ottowia thiooxydans]|uniref:DUF349 domain-containing protein n=1 Tax=Ottowia thiooxydans TaxID=219182 RepID=UPI0003F82633|nr:DUF349 domain-containing protein [Ottowia thiooxydans]